MRKKHRLEDKVLLCKPVKEGDARYVPYCIFGWHQGFVMEQQRRQCERRKCRHYRKLYISYV